MRTSSEPARASAATWRVVASTSAVSVLVIDCTTIGAPPPTVTAPFARADAHADAGAPRGRPKTGFVLRFDVFEVRSSQALAASLEGARPFLGRRAPNVTRRSDPGRLPSLTPTRPPHRVFT